MKSKVKAFLMRVLIVVAHPDDEVLGCGATMGALAEAGIEVRCCIASGSVNARNGRPEPSDLATDMQKAHALLGLSDPIVGDFPNIQFNTVPHLEMVQFVEKAIIETGANTIFTHHPQDLNNDHLHLSRACQAAARLSQRRSGVTPLRALYFMEILSSTDWAFPGGPAPFCPDTFFEVGELMLQKKLDALAAYRGVMRDFPHPRSTEIVRGLAAYRGGQAGVKYAEAFQTAFRALSARSV